MLMLLTGALCAGLLSSCSREEPTDNNPETNDEWSVVISATENADTKATITSLERDKDYIYTATVYRNGVAYDYDGEWSWKVDDESVLALSSVENTALVHTCQSGESILKAYPVDINPSLYGYIDLTVKSKLIVTVVESSYYDQLVASLYFDTGGEEWTGEIGLVFSYSAFSGTPTISFCKENGLIYSEYLNNFADNSHNITSNFTVPAGTEQVTWTSSAVGVISFFKRNAVAVTRNGSNFGTIELVFEKDYTRATDNYLYAIPASSGGSSNTHVPEYLGTYYYVFTDYAHPTNPSNSSNYNISSNLSFKGMRTASGSYSSSAYPPAGYSLNISLNYLVSPGVYNTLESTYVNTGKKSIPLSFCNATSSGLGNGYKYSDYYYAQMYCKVNTTTITLANGDYYTLEYRN